MSILFFICYFDVRLTPPWYVRSAAAYARTAGPGRRARARRPAGTRTTRCATRATSSATRARAARSVAAHTAPPHTGT